MKLPSRKMSGLIIDALVDAKIIKKEEFDAAVKIATTEIDVRKAMEDADTNARDLTAEQAYAAMFRFLEQYYERTKAGEVGGLLADISIMPDGKTADPAALKDWREAVNYALQGGKAGRLVLGAKST